MARTRDIFIASGLPMEIFTKEVALLLDIELQLQSDREEMFSEFRDQHIVLTLGTHEMENDREMHFEDYRYHISIRALNIKNEQQRTKWCQEFADTVYKKLKATRKYPLMLVDMSRFLSAK
ncbi:hypothetical protein [Candidatus Entotheonella palauensis]|nr:hypothetical protein [Candidatus Entotheonella palauensis]